MTLLEKKLGDASAPGWNTVTVICGQKLFSAIFDNYQKFINVKLANELASWSTMVYDIWGPKILKVGLKFTTESFAPDLYPSCLTSEKVSKSFK